MDYKKFFELVKASLAPDLEVYKLTDEDLVNYMKREEDTIKDGFEYGQYRVERGEITKEQFATDSVSATAHCLYLLYK